jgi:hypothetical protein
MYVPAGNISETGRANDNVLGRTPNSSNGGRTPANKETEDNSDKMDD